jgi:hypothetical protein
MKGLVLASIVVLTFFVSVVLFAKGPTLKVVISGADLSAPIEIGDRGRLADFNIWTGPGTSPSKDDGFVANWSSAVTAPPANVKRYRVSFYANHHGDAGADYLIVYAYDPAGRRGYVYLPGRGEVEYERNTFSIYRGVEGKWFLTRKAWDDLAAPLIERATKSSK